MQYMLMMHILIQKFQIEVKDGYIKDYAEFSNANKKITVDNDYRRRLRDADAQLYTEKTGSFSLGLDRSIDMKTTAPIVGMILTNLLMIIKVKETL